MSNNRNNSEFAGLWMVLMIFGMIALIIMAAVAMYLTIYTFVLTVGCVMAWNKPVTFEDHTTIFPEEARAFVVRGLIGAAAALLIAVTLNVRKDVDIDKEAYWFIALAGYIVGSLGVQALMSPSDAQGNLDIFPARAIPLPPPPVTIDADYTDITTPEPEPEPFQFADWDDAEVRQ